MLLIVLVTYSAWICPFEFAFLPYKQDTLFIIDNIVNGFFAIDIILTFFVAYLDSHSYLLVDDHKKIAVRYVSNLLTIFLIVAAVRSQFLILQTIAATNVTTQIAITILFFFFFILQCTAGTYLHGLSLMCVQLHLFNQSVSSSLIIVVRLGSKF